MSHLKGRCAEFSKGFPSPTLPTNLALFCFPLQEETKARKATEENGEARKQFGCRVTVAFFHHPLRVAHGVGFSGLKKKLISD